MLHNLTTRENIARHLIALTNASRLQRQGDHPAMRDLGERSYNEIYQWLEEHHVQYEYDRTQGCYVEVENDE